MPSPAGERKPWENTASRFGPGVPARDRADDRLHVGQAPHRVPVPVGPVETERGPPVVDHEDDVRRNANRLQQTVEVVPVFHEPVAVRPTLRQLRGIAHPDQVRRHQPALPLQVRHHVAPQVRRGRIAVQKDDRIALAMVDIGHLETVDLDPFLLVARVGGDHLRVSSLRSVRDWSAREPTRLHSTSEADPSHELQKAGEDAGAPSVERHAQCSVQPSGVRWEGFLGGRRQATSEIVTSTNAVPKRSRQQRGPTCHPPSEPERPLEPLPPGAGRRGASRRYGPADSP